MSRYYAPLDPDCPDVIEFYESLDDPMTVYYGVSTDLIEDFEPKHRVKCKRCQEYGAANIEII